MSNVIDLRSRNAIEVDLAGVRFSEFVTARYGRQWYTARRRVPRMAERAYISPVQFAQLKQMFRDMTGRDV